MILFGDFKQLPPATSRAPFIVLPSVYGSFDFRVLNQNRRVVSDDARRAEIEEFHAKQAEEARREKLKKTIAFFKAK